jgi:hypothetical protein
VEYKNVACGEQWDEIERYVLKAVSGKDSFKSKEFARLFEDIRTGKMNTILCTSLDRISRSVKDFADSIMNQWTSLASEDSGFFLKDKPGQLGKRRSEIETGIEALKQMIEEIEREAGMFLSSWL